MATKTFEELKQMAIQIRDEKTNKQNTATRIGTQMLEHLNKLEQEYYDKTNIDEQKNQTDTKLSDIELNIKKTSVPLFQRGYIRSLDGTLSNDPSATNTGYIFVKAGVKVEFSTRITSVGYALAVFTNEKVIILDKSIKGNSTVQNVKYTMEEDGYIIVSAYSFPSANCDIFIDNNLGDRVSKNTQDIASNTSSILSIKDTIGKYFVIKSEDLITKETEIKTNSYINNSGGTNNLGGEFYRRTNAIQIPKGVTKIKYVGKLDGTYTAIALYSSPTISAETAIKIIKGQDLSPEERFEYIIDIPENALYIAASFVGTDNSLFHLYIEEVTSDGKTIEEIAYELEDFNKLEYAFSVNRNILSIFESFFGCGDSLTEGIYGKPDEKRTYPWFVNKLTGWTYKNAGRWGGTPTTWWNEKFSLFNYADYDVVFIYLGTNDTLTDTLVQDTTITEGQTYLDYANTNTGNYCKIIEGMLAQNKDLVIALVSRTTKKGSDKWGVVVQIAEKYNLPVLNINDSSIVDLNNSLFHYPDKPDLTHFNTLGRYYMAYILLSQFSIYIKSNGDRFKYYKDLQNK